MTTKTKFNKFHYLFSDITAIFYFLNVTNEFHSFY
jgi:hypothetical protein